MDSLQDYDDTDAIAGDSNEVASTVGDGNRAPSTANPFRINSLCLASFPWSTVIPMVSDKLVENIGDNPEQRYPFVSYQFNRFIMSIH